MDFEHITDDILRLKVPFENIYTAVFLIRGEGGYILVDAAACERDAKEVILPALTKCIDPCEIKYLFCTHLHGDHGGGIRHLLPYLKNAKVAAASARAVELYGKENVQTVHDGDMLCGIKALSLAGHSLDSMGLVDERSSTLILGDAVQLYGITKYGCGVGFPKEYRETLSHIGKMGVQRLVASHEYYPLGADAEGDNVGAYIEKAKSAFLHVENFVRENRHIGDAAAIAASFTAEARKSEPDMPALQSYTVKALLSER
ncbi:MAG: MBL fold metallo-hydrolase [Clostridia bacterium]|nr:MBL fold metallo-hydrolase [Clostridia bacterium]